MSQEEPVKILEPPQVPRFHKSEIPPQFLWTSWRDYKTRYLPQFPTNSPFDYMFGRVKTFEREATLHPCQQVAHNFHRCMDHNDNKIDFCRSVFNIVEGCMREYKL